jgi:hypothetical protein
MAIEGGHYRMLVSLQTLPGMEAGIEGSDAEVRAREHGS